MNVLVALKSWPLYIRHYHKGIYDVFNITLQGFRPEKLTSFKYFAYSFSRMFTRLNDTNQITWKDLKEYKVTMAYARFENKPMEKSRKKSPSLTLIYWRFS